jgi:hypothetical protein
MIVEAIDDERLRLVTQPDHAAFSAQLLGLWRADGLPEHPRRAELLFAAREHDNGWRELDSAPRIGRDGAPLDFLRVDDATRREVWARGTQRYAETHPYAAALIVEHALHLLGGWRGTPAGSDFVDDLETLREELLLATRTGPDDLVADYGWIELADRASLLACGARPLPDPTRTLEREGIADGRIHLTIGPFPLAGNTTFTIPCRTVARRRYARDADFAVAAASAAWKELVVSVRKVS